MAKTSAATGAAPPRGKQRYQFDPIPMLDAAARVTVGRALGAPPRAPDALRAWQRTARQALAERLGFLDEKPVTPRPREIHRVDRGAYVRHKIVLRTTARSELPLYLLIPKPANGKPPRPRPCVLALHGHGYGARDVVGLWEDGSERLTPDGYHKDFGCALAKRGFVVAVPEISCFGERQMEARQQFGGAGMSATCHNVATYAMMLGKSAAGLRVLDAMRVVDYLQARREIDGGNIGVMGISGGGMHALFSAAIDERIRASVISGYFCDWRHSILSLFHCTCNFVPGLLELGELSDLAALLAPRPCLVEHGLRDTIFPIEHVKRTVEKARRAWQTFGAADQLQTDYFDGRHRINGEAAYPFLAHHLGL